MRCLSYTDDWLLHAAPITTRWSQTEIWRLDSQGELYRLERDVLHSIAGLDWKGSIIWSKTKQVLSAPSTWLDCLVGPGPSHASGFSKDKAVIFFSVCTSHAYLGQRKIRIPAIVAKHYQLGGNPPGCTYCWKHGNSWWIGELLYTLS